MILLLSRALGLLPDVRVFPLELIIVNRYYDTVIAAIKATDTDWRDLVALRSGAD